MKFNNGIHHISVLAGKPSKNHNFYVNILGMRMVKKSVNQDDPSTYHLFYGNKAAEPGSSLTFFPWPNARQGVPSSGQSVNVAFRVPEGSEDFWIDRLNKHEVEISDIFTQFGEKALRFKDPDGLEIDFIFKGTAQSADESIKSSVPDEYAVQSFWSTRLRVTKPDATATVLKSLFKFQKVTEENGLILLSTNADKGENVIIEPSETDIGKNGSGIVHHVAFRAENKSHLSELRDSVIEMGLNPSEIIDRYWFNSVYFREPSGVLFEIATDDPGYTVDEEFNELGSTLILPPWLEPRRKLIENTLPELNI